MELKPEPGFGEDWYVSHYNLSEPSSGGSAPEPRIHDTTLRDGEQQAGVVFSKEEKVAIARLLAQCGVDRIETSIPIVSEDDQLATAEIASLELPAETWVAVRAVTKDIDLAASLNVDGAGVICMANDQYLDIFGWTLADVLDQVCEAVERAKNLHLAATVLIVDSSRMSRDRLATIIQTVQSRTESDGYAFMDTYGALSPQGIKKQIAYGCELTDRPIEIHTHNDFGLATANALTAVEAGASVVHTSVHGLGERVGNAPLEEFVLAAKLLYGLKLEIDLSRLARLSDTVEEASRVTMPPNKAIVGAFNRIESGFVAAEYLRLVRDKGYPEQWLFPFAPSLVGGADVEIVLGKGSGLANVQYHLERAGVELDGEAQRSLLERLKSRSIELHREIHEHEFAQILSELKEGELDVRSTADTLRGNLPLSL